MAIPYVRGSETSKAAAESIKHSATSDRVKVFNYLVQCGKRGATDDEIEAALDMRHQTASARRRSLENDQAVRKTDRKRKTRSGRSAYVYVAESGADINARRGRPTKSPDGLKKLKVTTYMTQEEYADVCMMAAERDVSVADIMRRSWVAYQAREIINNQAK